MFSKEAVVDHGADEIEEAEDYIQQRVSLFINKGKVSLSRVRRSGWKVWGGLVGYTVVVVDLIDLCRYIYSVCCSKEAVTDYGTDYRES